MQILSSTVDMLRWALARWDRDSMVELSQACRWGQDNILKYDVNWSCCGSVSVEEAERFIDSLKVATKLATEINNCRYEVVDIDRLQGPELPEALRLQKGDEERSEVAKLAELLKRSRVSPIARWLDDQRIS